MDELKWGRKKSTVVVGVIMVVLGTLSSLGYGRLGFVKIIGMQFLDFFDFLTNSVMMPIAAIATCLLVSRVIGVKKIEQESPNLLDLILGHRIDLVIDTPPQGADRSRDGFLIRRNAIETGVNVLTAMDTARALVTSLENTDIRKLTLVDIAKVE